jgi:hypothetical protein
MIHKSGDLPILLVVLKYIEGGGTVMDIFMYLLDFPFVKELVIGLAINYICDLFKQYKMTVKIEKR